MLPRKPAIIVDLDGTLSNSDHRVHYVEKAPKNWKRFFAEAEKDHPNRWCVELIRSMHATGCGYSILFVTARGAEMSEQTVIWLEKHNLLLGQHLFMRPADDRRPDFVVKEEIYRKAIEPYFDVLFVVEDRQQVVDMWRRIGLTCLQCAAWEEHHETRNKEVLAALNITEEMT